MRSTWFHAATIVALALLVNACGSRSTSKSTEQASSSPAPADQTMPAGEVHVTTIDLGSELQADKHVAQSMSTFKSDQTIYASVATDGTSPSATVTARWLAPDGSVVTETTETIAPTGPEVTEFHISKPDGWPPGKYAVEILVNGNTAGRREFEIKS
jgi:hypothetical protein